MEVTESMLESRSSVEQWVLEALESDDA